MNQDLSPLQHKEREALVDSQGSRATLELVTALRRYRQISKELLNQRYADGECDSYALYRFSEAMNDIEELKG